MANWRVTVLTRNQYGDLQLYTYIVYIVTNICIQLQVSILISVTKQSSLLVMQRSYSSSKDLQYEDLLELKKKDVILIDVREHHEIEETGKLPGSINIPLGELKSGLESTSEIFENKYGIKKPSPEMTICFSCRSGKRSKMALDIALNLGFSNACHYAGGFLDWQKHNPS